MVIAEYDNAVPCVVLIERQSWWCKFWCQNAAFNEAAQKRSKVRALNAGLAEDMLPITEQTKSLGW